MYKNIHISTHIAAITALLFLVSCDSGEYIKVKEATLFNDKSFMEIKMILHKDIDTVFIGNPVRVSLIDSLLYAVFDCIEIYHSNGVLSNFIIRCG
jgi:hypothetical protein